MVTFLPPHLAERKLDFIRLVEILYVCVSELSLNTNGREIIIISSGETITLDYYYYASKVQEHVGENYTS